jgi:hypothetical protein
LCATPDQWTNEQNLADLFKPIAFEGTQLKPIFRTTQFRRKSMQTSKKNQIRTEELRLNRRHLVRWVLGGSTALALVACGGGGGGDDDSSQSGRSLRPAHDALQPGMDRQDVIDTVGRLPDNDVPETMTWRQNGELLRVSFGYMSSTDTYHIAGSLWVAPSPSAERDNRQFV